MSNWNTQPSLANEASSPLDAPAEAIVKGLQQYSFFEQDAIIKRVVGFVSQEREKQISDARKNLEGESERLRQLESSFKMLLSFLQ